MTVLVTGGAGYVGSHTVWALHDRGIPAVVYDNLSAGHREAVGSTPLIVGELADTDLLKRTIERFEVDAIVHFAARAVVPESVAFPLRYWENNVGGTLSLVQAAVAAGVRRLVFSSTAGVYGEHPVGPLVEEHPTAPHHPYGRTKLAVETLLDDCARAGLLRAFALRYFNAAGADGAGRTGELHDPESHLIPRLLMAATGEDEAFRLFGTDWPTRDGTCERDYIHVADLARAHLLALDWLATSSDGVGLQRCNLGSGQGRTVRELIDAAAVAVGQPLKVEEHPRRAGDPAILIAQIGRARQLLGWAPECSDVATILGSALAWHRSPTRAAWARARGV